MDQEDEEKAAEVLVRMAKNKVRQFIYDAKMTAISHFYAETKGVRKLKDTIIDEKLEEKMKSEDYMLVSKLSFYSMFIQNCIICS